MVGELQVLVGVMPLLSTTDSSVGLGVEEVAAGESAGPCALCLSLSKGDGGGRVLSNKHQV